MSLERYQSLMRRREWSQSAREMLARSVATGHRPGRRQSGDRCAYWRAYHKRRYEADQSYRDACIARAAKWVAASRAAETPEQRRERLTDDKVRRVLRAVEREAHP